MNALIDGLYLSIRLRHACVRSTGETSRRRIESDACFSVRVAKSGDAAEAVNADEAAAPIPIATNSLRDKCINHSLQKVLGGQLRPPLVPLGRLLVTRVRGQE